jgi:hypothetical protein
VSAFDPQPYLDEDGEQVGWIVGADDGETYLTELDGSVAAVWDDDAEGWDLDVDVELDYGEPEPYEDPRFAAYDERMDRIEALAAQPRPVEVVAGIEQADYERIGQDMSVQAAHLEAALGRPLLIDERRRIAHAAYDDIEAGDARPDLFEAAARTGGLLDLDDDNPHRAREARVEYMTQRLADQDRAANTAQGLDDITAEQPPPTQVAYDLDDRDERQAYYADRLRGVTDASATFSSSDYAEQEWSDE